MKLSGNIAIREMSRNKIRLIMACLISLILFLSAFMLINISYALPANFYKYFEEFNEDKLSVEITNADKKLIIDRDSYFDRIELQYHFMDEKFTLTNTVGDQSFKHSQEAVEDAESGVMHVYNAKIGGNFASVKESLLKNYDKIDGIGKSIIVDEMSEVDESKAIWLSSRVADKLEVGAGGTIKLKLDANAPMTANGIISFDAIIGGIYDYDLHKSKVSNPPVYYMSDAIAALLYIESYDSYSMVGIIGNVDDLYNVYNNLSKTYNLEDNLYVDMITTVKTAEWVCAIIGACMLIGGMIVMTNYISMFISTNRKSIGLMLALGASSTDIALGYSYIFIGLLAFMVLIATIILPTVNALVSMFIGYIGYSFAITTNYWLLYSLYGMCNLMMMCLMILEKMRIKRLSPHNVLKEED